MQDPVNSSSRIFQNKKLDKPEVKGNSFGRLMLYAVLRLHSPIPKETSYECAKRSGRISGQQNIGTAVQLGTEEYS